MHRTLTLTETIYTLEQLQAVPADVPQIAVAGRSNVGKSSLINCLAGRKKLAKISSTPGKTRSVNLYQAAPGDYYIVDLPGYGYARCSKAERNKWAELIGRYLAETPGLRAVAVLMDSRLNPQELDLEMVSYVHQSGLDIIAILTKADKCKQKDLAKRQAQWADFLRTGGKPMVFSSKTGRGRDKLWAAMDMAAGFDPEQLVTDVLDETKA
ncbi:MAG: ribosome biogenesis GTP-binding protein YihA/YsxC [Desulfovibrio sp.]|uniref:ribosome biogenesis GTP-binding protein YihA/YsxC n=1 Tax=Desulfovibrio sp. 7SRBS1 TaxID=3378064 RepID=UPI003B41C284